MPMSSRSVRPTGNRHSYGGYASGADTPDGSVACQECAASGEALPTLAAPKAASPLSTSVRTLPSKASDGRGLT